MHFSLPLSISLILLPLLQHVSFAAAAPEAIPAPPRLRISLPQFSSGAAVIISTDGTTRAYYQDGDGGLHEVSGPFFVDENVFFDDDLILAAGGARKDTPLAVVDLTGTGFLRLYYVAPNNQLKELVNNNDGVGWFDGDLNKFKIYVRRDSRYLYAIAVQGVFQPRVGFESPVDKLLSEAAFNPETATWAVSTLG